MTDSSKVVDSPPKQSNSVLHLNEREGPFETKKVSDCDLWKNHVLKEEDKEYNRSLSDDYFLNCKKLKEAETKLRSLSLILEETRSGKCDSIDYVALKESKVLLENKVLKLKETVSSQEVNLGNLDIKSCLFRENHSHAHGRRTVDEPQNNLKENLGGKDFGENKNVSEVCFESTRSSEDLDKLSETQEFSESTYLSEDDVHIIYTDKNSCTDFLRDENIRLRRRLSEARQKHKSERNSVLEQLRMLEIETLDGEKRWVQKVQSKQVELEKCTEKKYDLIKKNQELMASLKDTEKLRKNEIKQWESKLKRKQEMISELKDKLVDAKTEKQNLEKSLSEVQNVSGEYQTKMNDLTKELQQALSNRNEIISKSNTRLEKCLEELKEAENEIKDLQRKAERLNNDKDHLKVDLEASRKTIDNEKLDIRELCYEKKLAEATAKCFVEVSLQTVKESEKISATLRKTKQGFENKLKLNEEMKNQLKDANSSIKTLKRDKLLNDGKTMELEQTLLDKERTIQDLTISLGKAIKKEPTNLEVKSKWRVENKNGDDMYMNEIYSDNSLKNMQEIMDKIKDELTRIQEDVTKHKESADTLEDKWRKYKMSMEEISKGFTKRY